MAAIRAMQIILNQYGEEASSVTLEIITDSAYLTNGLSSWIINWKKLNWNKEIVNKELWKNLDELRQRFLEVKLTHVLAHNGHFENEMADKLASDGCFKSLPL
eukprot:TRINITY_DN1013_c0_g1_i6.p2 TRINITY_DN1013_c0_g1~~TRINITY_DN1013_c0_g1_i6.p2  ORF type:complete len:103 (-),score=19.87 TRINITY_DN1013_c0_g1_i6:151-459(-)